MWRRYLQRPSALPRPPAAVASNDTTKKISPLCPSAHATQSPSTPRPASTSADSSARPIPEPSTDAMITGILALAFVQAARRRK
jgi:hypothetical protein